MVDEQHQSQLAAFFSSMHENLVNEDIDGLIGQHHIPAIFVDEGNKTICANTNEIKQKLTNIIDMAHTVSASRFECNMVQSIRLSENIFFVQVKWQWFDEHNHRVNRRMTSYTMQKVADNTYAVVVSVTDEQLSEN